MSAVNKLSLINKINANKLIKIKVSLSGITVGTNGAKQLVFFFPFYCYLKHNYNSDTNNIT